MTQKTYMYTHMSKIWPKWATYNNSEKHQKWPKIDQKMGLSGGVLGGLWTGFGQKVCMPAAFLGYFGICRFGLWLPGRGAVFGVFWVFFWSTKNEHKYTPYYQMNIHGCDNQRIYTSITPIWHIQYYIIRISYHYGRCNQQQFHICIRCNTMF